MLYNSNQLMRSRTRHWSYKSRGTCQSLSTNTPERPFSFPSVSRVHYSRSIFCNLVYLLDLVSYKSTLSFVFCFSHPFIHPSIHPVTPCFSHTSSKSVSCFTLEYITRLLDKYLQPHTRTFCHIDQHCYIQTPTTPTKLSSSFTSSIRRSDRHQPTQSCHHPTPRRTLPTWVVAAITKFDGVFP